jgi:ankyrin repeat protein
MSKEHQLSFDKHNDVSLHQAIRSGDIVFVERLIRAGVAVDSVTDYGYSALDLAAEAGNLQIINLLLEAGADVDYSQESSPLHMAVKSGHVDVVKHLIEAGANLEIEADDGITPLMEAVERGELEIIRLLVEAGADFQATDRYGKSVFQQAAQAGQEEVLEYLCQLMPKAERQAVMQANLVERCVAAIKEGNVDLVKALINQGVDVNARSDENWTLLMYAAFYGQVGIVKALVKLGADLEARTRSGDTALMHAASQHHWKVVEALLRAGADVNVISNDGDNALDSAATFAYGHKRRTRWKTIKVLLSFGVDKSITNNILGWARKVGDNELTQLLEKYLKVNGY